MPKARQRIVECDCLDCRDPAVTDTGLLLSAANEAVAKQDPPPKCLLLLLTGAARQDPEAPGETSLDAAAQSLPHLRRAAQEGGLGLLALRPNPAGLPELEAAQLLGVPQDGGGAASAAGEVQTLSQRFQGMRAAFDSTTPAVRAVCEAAGMQPVALLRPAQDSQGPDPAAAAHDIIRHLGIPQASPAPAAASSSSSSTGATEVDPDLDLLLLHLDATTMPAAPQPGEAETTAAQRAYQGACGALEWADALLKHLAAEPAVRETVLLALVLTPAGQPVAPGALRPSGAVLPSGRGGGAGGAPQLLRPVQSFERLEGKPVVVDLDAPAVVLRRLAGVVRRDAAAGLGVGEAAARGVHGVILADRLLHEVAYKVAKAPKYGA